jgi:DNA-binding transcriptional regulator GbsR (MarR family)
METYYYILTAFCIASFLLGHYIATKMAYSDVRDTKNLCEALNKKCEELDEAATRRYEQANEMRNLLEIMTKERDYFRKMLNRNRGCKHFLNSGSSIDRI